MPASWSWELQLRRTLPHEKDFRNIETVNCERMNMEKTQTEGEKKKVKKMERFAQETHTLYNSRNSREVTPTSRPSNAYYFSFLSEKIKKTKNKLKKTKKNFHFFLFFYRFLFPVNLPWFLLDNVHSLAIHCFNVPKSFFRAEGFAAAAILKITMQAPRAGGSIAAADMGKDRSPINLNDIPDSRTREFTSSNKVYIYI